MTTTPKKKAADQAADDLREAILAGEFEAGQRLPGERELSERLGVSRLTLRNALARLESEGLVRPVHGSGNLVLDYRETGGVDVLAYLAKSAIADGRMPTQLFGALLELRRMVAVEMLGLVAERATPEELAALRAHRDRQQGLVDDPVAFMEADLEFARMLVRSAKNLALELLFNTIQRIVAENRGFEAAFLVNAQGTLDAYGKLLDLIEARDPHKVRRMARRLLVTLDRVTLDRLHAFGRLLEGAAEPSTPQSTEETT